MRSSGLRNRWVSRRGLPDPGGTIVAGGGHPTAIGTEARRKQNSATLIEFELRFELPCFQIPDIHQGLGIQAACSCQSLPIRRNGKVTNDSRFHFQNGDVLPSRSVQQPKAGLSACNR